MYVNVNNGERLDSGETAKTTTRRRFLGAISFLYHHDNVYTCADPGIFVGFGGEGVQARLTEKSSGVFLYLFCKSSIHFEEGIYLQNNNYHSTKLSNIPWNRAVQHFQGGGPTFHRGWGSNCISLYTPKVLVILQGVGSGPPATTSGAAHGIVNWVRPHIVLATRQSMTLSSLMQVLLALGYYATGSFCLVIGDTLGVSKDARTRVVHRVSKALRAMGLFGRGLVLFPTSFYNIVVTYKIPNYPHALSHNVCGDHKC